MKNKSFTYMILSACLFCVIIYTTYSFDKEPVDEIKSLGLDLSEPKVLLGKAPSLKLYNAINKYAKKYNIPRRYAFAIAKFETGYRGPFHWKYRIDQTSPVGALGPMQIMPDTGNRMWDRKVDKNELMYNIAFNVETSMKLLRKLYDKHGNWKHVFGAYHTGHPCVDWYAQDVYNYSYDFVRL